MTMNQSVESQLIKALVTRRRPRILFHYTSGAGLIGILESRSIWATNIRFLNDSTEYDFAVGLARRVIQERIDKARNKFEVAVASVLQERLTTDPAADVYVTSFSENADQLSQWRAYSPPTGGYALGFRAKSLLEPALSNPSFFLTPCIYDSLSQEKLIRKLFDDVLVFAEESHNAGLTHDRVFREAFKLFGRLIPLAAPAIKHPSFVEEQEWRLVRLPASFDFELPQIREGRSMLIPYHRHSFPKPENMPIEEVVVGPTPNPILARDAAEALLLSRGLTSAIARSSSIPYRVW